MGKIMLNEISYSGGGGNADIVRLTQAEYDALPSSKLTDNKVYMITDVNGDGSQFQPVIYSENEREIGVWIDGKPLYQKCYKLNKSIGNISTNLISDLNIDNVIDLHLIMFNSYKYYLSFNVKADQTNNFLLSFGESSGDWAHMLIVR